MRVEKCDVLVIGSGGAGLRAAIEAHDRGAGVIVVGKSKRGDAHTVLATGGINAALGTMDSGDRWRVHAADTLKEGWFLADYRDVETLCRKAPEAVQELDEWGVRFHRESDGRLTQRFFGAHTYRRTCFVGDETGKAIMRALMKQTKNKFPFYGELYIASLVKEGGVKGALGFDMKTGERVLFSSRSVVLAAGGHSRLYRRSSSRNFENTGDGIALAYGAGAELQDMEMVQFHPTGMVHPKGMSGVLVTEAVRGEGGHLYNSKGERFMDQYDPDRMELSARDVVSKAIYHEIDAGRGTKHGGVWLDISHQPVSYIKKRLPKMYRQFKKIGVDISKQKMEVAPTAHYSMGGVRVDYRTGETSVPGLLAAGEVTGGLHGANRLGGNSLAEILVFGKIAGARAAGKKKQGSISRAAVKRATLAARFAGGASPEKMKSDIREIMWKKAGIEKNEKRLKSAMKSIERLKKKKLSGSVFEALDAKAMLLAAEAVVRCALLRKESRGAHFRSDHPDVSKKYLFNFVCRRRDGKMRITRESVKKPRGPITRYFENARKYGYVE